MISIELQHLRANACEFLLDADCPLPLQRIARHLFGPHRHEQPEAQIVVRALLADDDRFVENHDRRWSARKAPHLRIPLTDASYTVVDLETTGSVIGVDEIIEIGVVVIRAGQFHERFSTLVRASRAIPPWVSRLTGIKQIDLAGAPTFTEVAPLLVDLLKGSIFVAHDIRFDLPFLRWEMVKRGLMMPEVTGLCTLCLARQCWAEWPSRSLPDLAERLAIPHANPHRAAADANAAAGVLVAALDLAADLGLTNVGDLFRPTVNGDLATAVDQPLWAAEAAD